jgi:hypothetical protein
MVANVALLLVALTWEDTVSDGEHIRIIFRATCDQAGEESL